MAQILMIVAPERFRDEELFATQAERFGLGIKPSSPVHTWASVPARAGSDHRRTDAGAG
ncbi:MAG: hypothetical protein HZY76_14735 [Anaerolineae bacterium]|nr:MAG: hypothetical protein HZY76_14735 [Anaerolineae bacterium]